jgi:hypothetical protein
VAPAAARKGGVVSEQDAELVALRERAERLRKAWYEVRDAEQAAYIEYHEALTEWLDARDHAARTGGGVGDGL